MANGDNRDPVNPSPGPCTETRYSVRGEAHGLHVADAERGYQLVDAYNRRIAPDLFDLDDDDYAVVKSDPVPDDQEDAAEQSIQECPRAALLRRD